MYYNGREFSNFRGINLMAANGAIRFEDADVAPTTTSGEYLMYVDGGVLYFDNGSSITALGSGSGGSVSWEAMYASDNTINIAGGNGLSIAGAMSNSNDVLTLTQTAAGSGHALQITNSGTGKDINGSAGTWSITKAGVATFAELIITSTVATDVFALTNNTITANNAFIVSGSGVFTGTGANAFANVTASGLTTGTAFAVIANAATTSIGAATISATALTSGSALLVTGGGANITTGGKVIEVAMGAATTGAGVSIVTSGVHQGTTTSSVSVISSAGDTGTLLYLVGNSLTTGVAQLITSSGTMTTTGSLLTLTGNSATTAAGLFRVNANGLTSGIGAVIASSATAITGAGRLLRVDHTGATGSTAILSEFASAANDETVIVKVTASDALALGTALQVSGASITTGSAITAANLNALTDGKGLHIASSATAISSSGNLLFVNHTGTTTASGAGVLAQFTTAATDATTVLGVTLSSATTTVGVKIADAGTGMTSGSLLRVSTASTGAVATNGVVSIRATGAYTSTSNVGLVDVLASGTTAGTVVRIAASAAGQTATELLRVVASGYTTGYTGNVANFIGVSTTGASNVVAISSANSTAGTALSVTANALTTGSAVLVTSSGTITSGSEGLLNLVASGMTSGSALKIDLTEGTLNGGYYINCYDDTGTASVFTVGEDGALTNGSGTVNFGGAFIVSGSETIAAAGTSTALSLAKTIHHVDADAGGDTFTLADGTIGQIMYITMESSTGVATITPANLAGGTSVTLDAAGDSVVLLFQDTDWYVIGGNSHTVS